MSNWTALPGHHPHAELEDWTYIADKGGADPMITGIKCRACGWQVDRAPRQGGYELHVEWLDHAYGGGHLPALVGGRQWIKIDNGRVVRL